MGECVCCLSKAAENCGAQCKFPTFDYCVIDVRSDFVKVSTKTHEAMSDSALFCPAKGHSFSMFSHIGLFNVTQSAWRLP